MRCTYNDHTEKTQYWTRSFFRRTRPNTRTFAALSHPVQGNPGPFDGLFTAYTAIFRAFFNMLDLSFYLSV